LGSATSKKYSPFLYSLKDITVPSFLYMCIAAAIDVSITHRHLRRTSDKEKMLARENGLCHIVPKFMTFPICVDICMPPLVETLSVRGLGRKFGNNLGLLKTDTVG
jgi:hypothetical protein